MHILKNLTNFLGHEHHLINFCIVIKVHSIKFSNNNQIFNCQLLITTFLQ
jgi:hypothetical protein